MSFATQLARRGIMHDCIDQVLEHKGHEVEVTAPDVTVIAAVEHMNARRIGALVVIADGEIVGIFTARDVLVRVVARGMDPNTTRVTDVMTRGPCTVAPNMTVNDALVVITDRRCRHLPVVDDAGALCGLISAGDLSKWIVRDQQRTIEDLHAYIRAA